MFFCVLLRDFWFWFCLVFYFQLNLLLICFHFVVFFFLFSIKSCFSILFLYLSLEFELVDHICFVFSSVCCSQYKLCVSRFRGVIVCLLTKKQFITFCCCFLCLFSLCCVFLSICAIWMNGFGGFVYFFRCFVAIHGIFLLGWILVLL